MGSKSSNAVVTEKEKPVHGITIWLDAYDDIFSDFDPREYESRALSDDFLTELRKLVREDDEKETLREFHLLIPAELRNKDTENIISHRLHSYFRKGLQRLKDEARNIRRKGVIFSLLGLLFLLVAGYISFLKPHQLGFHLLMISLEPAGWFFVWLGYDNLVNGTVRKKPDIDFHVRMTRNSIRFRAM